MANEQKEPLDVELFWSPVTNKEKFEGKARAVSSENKVGEFDILPGHANFITLIFNSITIKTIDQGEQSYEFKRGVLEIANNKVEIFLGV